MDAYEQMDAFSVDITSVIEYYKREFTMAPEAMVGVLEQQKFDLLSINVTFEPDMDIEEEEDGTDDKV